MKQKISLDFRKTLLLLLCSGATVLSSSIVAAQVDRQGVDRQQKAVSGSPFTLHGSSHFNGEWKFSLRDKRNDSSFWLRLGQTFRGAEAVAYDEVAQELTLSFDGQVAIIALEQADERAIDVVESRVMHGYQEVELPELPNRAPPSSPPNGGAPPALPAPKTAPEIPKSIQQRDGS